MSEVKPSQDDLLELVLATAREVLEDELEDPSDLDADSRLLGDGGFDSIALVALVAALEEAIEDTFEVSVSLADDRALSQKNSPFRTFASLAGYARSLLDPSRT